MRIAVTPRRVELAEEQPFQVSITVTNTGDLIGGYHVRVLGADPSWVRLETENLSLFPDTSETLTATITIPRGMGAGDRRIAIQVRELTPPQAISVAEIDVVVPARQALKLALSPMTVICGSTGRFGLVVENSGNTSVLAQPIGLDPENKITFTFLPSVISLAPGEHAITDMTAKAKRRWFGTPVVRSFGLAVAPEDGIPPPPPSKSRIGRTVPGAVAPAPPKIEPLATGTMLQKARLARGAISLLSLLLAVTVFAVVITIALSRLVGVSAADRDLALQVAAARQADSSTGTSTLGGTVKLLTDGSPASGVAVELFDAASLTSPLTSTATDNKGVWAIPALPEGSYKLRFRGAGFAEIWYPGALTGADGKAVALQAGQKLTNLETTLGGLPASVSGTVLGDDVAGAVLTVSVPASNLPRDGAPPPKSGPLVTLTGAPVTPGAPAAKPPAKAPAGAAATKASTPAPGQDGAALQTVPIGSDGAFTISDVASPAVYDLTVVKAGYATATQRIDLSGGENRTGVQLRLRTGDGLIAGTISSPAGPLGGAVITATTGTSGVKTVSLTTGAVGSFTLRGLVTPGTYTITVTKDGYTTQSSALTLNAGQKLTGVQLSMGKSSGSLSGVVTMLPDNKPAPGVTVTIVSGATTVTTVTQSSGSIGTWVVSEMPIPGAYTVTFSRPDLQSQTVAVSLDSGGKLSGGTATGVIAVGMKSAFAVIRGTVFQHRADSTTTKVGEAVLTLTSATNTYTVISSSAPAASMGSYEIANVVPGTYTVSASLKGTTPTTEIVTLSAGEIHAFDPVMIEPAQIHGTVTDRGGGSTAAFEVDLYLAANYPSKIYKTTSVDEHGLYTFPDIDAPQAYVVEVKSATQGSLGSASVVVAASQSTLVDMLVGLIPLTSTSTTPTTPATTAVSTTPPTTTAKASVSVVTVTATTTASATSSAAPGLVPPTTPATSTVTQTIGTTP